MSINLTDDQMRLASSLKSAITAPSPDAQSAKPITPHIERGLAEYRQRRSAGDPEGEAYRSAFWVAFASYLNAGFDQN